MLPEYPDREHGGSTARRKKKLSSLLEYYRNRPNAQPAAPVNTLNNLASRDADKAVNVKSEPLTEKSPETLAVAESLPAEQAPADTSDNGRRKIVPKRTAIGSLLKEVKQEIRVKHSDENKVELTAVSLPELWKAFLDDFRHKAQPSFLSVADTQQPSLREETIVFTVPNNISLEMLQLHKSDIMAYFLDRTTARLQLEFQLDRKAEPTRTIRSPKDRLREMAANNDAVNKLIQKFDLNLD